MGKFRPFIKVEGVYEVYSKPALAVLMLNYGLNTSNTPPLKEAPYLNYIHGNIHYINLL